MRNKKLIPFEIIEKAVAGEPESYKRGLTAYSPRIKINDDIQDRLKAQHIKAILQFHLDRW